MFAIVKVQFYTDRQKSLPLRSVAQAFFMSVTKLLYIAGSTIRAYVVMAYASLSVLSFDSGSSGYPLFLCPHNVINNAEL